MKFKIRETVYDAASMYKLPLKMVLQLQMESRDFGREIQLADVEVWSDELDKCKTDKDRSEHPASPWLLAVIIWASRKLAGEHVNFEQAIDIPMDELVFLKEPQDHKRAANPTKGRPRKGSGPAAKRAPVKAAAKTSSPVSTAE